MIEVLSPLLIIVPVWLAFSVIVALIFGWAARERWKDDP